VGIFNRLTLTLLVIILPLIRIFLIINLYSTLIN